MQNINISLPSQLKKQASLLVSQGYYASMSDLVRDALRKVIRESQYDILAKKAKKEEKEGKTSSLASKDDIEKFINTL